jgi:hypothetical protein
VKVEQSTQHLRLLRKWQMRTAKVFRKLISDTGNGAQKTASVHWLQQVCHELGPARDNAE